MGEARVDVAPLGTSILIEVEDMFGNSIGVHMSLATAERLAEDIYRLIKQIEEESEAQ